MKKLVKIKNIASYSKGSQINGDELMENAEYDYLNGGIKPSGRWNETNCEANTVTISEGGNSCGYVNYMSKPFWCGAHCYYLFETVKNTRYLYYALKSQQNRIMKLRSGACMPNIKKVDLGNFEFIFDDDESEQDKVTSILSGIEKIITISKREVQLLDDLVNARFVEMFGDVNDNPYRYKLFPIKDVIKKCEAGWSGNGTQRIKKDDEIAVLKVSAVTKGYFIPDEYKVLKDQYNIKKMITPQKGDLIFSRANTREMVGATAIIYENYPTLILPDKLWRITFNEYVNVFYMKYILSSKSMRYKFSEASTGTSGSMYNISMEKFMAISIPIAPIELQNRFADFVNQVAKSKLILKNHHFERGILSGDKFFIS